MSRCGFVTGFTLQGVRHSSVNQSGACSSVRQPGRISRLDHLSYGLDHPFRSQSPATAAFPVSMPARLPPQSSPGLLDVHSPYDPPSRRTDMRPLATMTTEAPPLLS
jgi:hypothetical protein